jgi:hypothetical protein
MRRFFGGVSHTKSQRDTWLRETLASPDCERSEQRRLNRRLVVKHELDLTPISFRSWKVETWLFQHSTGYLYRTPSLGKEVRFGKSYENQSVGSLNLLSGRGLETLGVSLQLTRFQMTSTHNRKLASLSSSLSRVFKIPRNFGSRSGYFLPRTALYLTKLSPCSTAIVP